MNLIEQNIIAILTAAVAIVSSWAICKTKVESLEKRMDAIDKTVTENKLSIGRREEAMVDVYRRLKEIDELKLDSKLASIEARLGHIQALLEKNVS